MTRRINLVDTNGLIMQSITACIPFEDKTLKFDFMRSVDHLSIDEQTEENPEYKAIFDQYQADRKNIHLTLYADKFLRMLTPIVNDSKGEILILGFDSRAWRKDFYPEYKENRKSAFGPYEKGVISDAFKITEEWLSEYVRLPMVRVPRCEYDDLAFACAKEFQKVTCHTSDSDLLQLYRFNGYKQVGFDGNQAKLHEDVVRWLTIKCLHGDKGDNVPNVKAGLGVVKWGKKYDDGTMDEFVIEGGLLPLYERNRTLIDLAYAPSDVQASALDAIVDAVNKFEDGFKPNMFNAMFTKLQFRPRREALTLLGNALKALS